MKDYLGYIAAKFLSFIFCLLPLRFSLFLGRGIGVLAFFINKKRRVVAYTNLKAAFCKEKGPAELRGLVKKVYQNLGQVLIEVLRFPVINSRYIQKFISIKGLKRLKEIMAQNKGIIILTGHFGNWELSSLIGGFLGFPISVLAREQKHTQLNELLNSYRQMAGCKVIKKGLSTRQLIKALQSGEIVGILADQDAGKLGIFVNFFGRPTSTHSGAFIFARKTGALILPTFIVREKGPYHRIDLLEPIKLKNNQDSDVDIYSAIQEFSNVLESYVRRYPSQWLWVHKRWKSTPQRPILILNDGKPGHLNQSIAVANIIQKYRQDKGTSVENTPYRIVDVRYKNNFLKTLLKICSNFSSSNC
ncbi:MAG: lysophospholipid acyltransferase family protein, partial [Candidatus Omnitrophica bacterium]|nr:lysophospholipid acyltransferase family protein [Candidatus Omnitrophota bacterium]